MQDMPLRSLDRQKLMSEEAGYLSKWARWKHAAAAKEAEGRDDDANDLADALFRDYFFAARLHLTGLVTNFNIWKRKDSKVHLHGFYWTSMFPLGARLESDHAGNDYFDSKVPFESLETNHIASMKSDYVLAVMAAATFYRVPDRWMEMTLPELVADGLQQQGNYHRTSIMSRLPKGLFETGPGSLLCDPKIFLSTDKISSLGDVYGSMVDSDEYRSIGDGGHVILKFRGSHNPSSTRMAHSATFETALGGKTTSDVLDLMRTIQKATGNSLVRGTSPLQLISRTVRMIEGDIAPDESAFSRAAHVKFIFRHMLDKERPWYPFPEIDHERVCYDLMCGFVGIHPDVAREKKLGLIVKVDDPPGIGFVNHQIYVHLRNHERLQQEQGLPSLQARTHVDATLSGDWLSVVVYKGNGGIELVLETMKTGSDFDPTTVPGLPSGPLLPIYTVVGVWSFSMKGDPSVGAELAHRWEDCNAVLL